MTPSFVSWDTALMLVGALYVVCFAGVALMMVYKAGDDWLARRRRSR